MPISDATIYSARIPLRLFVTNCENPRPQKSFTLKFKFFPFCKKDSSQLFFSVIISGNISFSKLKIYK